MNVFAGRIGDLRAGRHPLEPHEKPPFRRRKRGSVAARARRPVPPREGIVVDAGRFPGSWVLRQSRFACSSLPRGCPPVAKIGKDFPLTVAGPRRDSTLGCAPASLFSGAVEAPHPCRYSVVNAAPS
jgi:hypothetical protein